VYKLGLIHCFAPAGVSAWAVVTPLYDLSEGNYAPCVRLRFGGQGDAYFCFLLDGAVTDGTFNYSSGKVIFFPAGASHFVEIVEQCRCLIVRVGPQLLSRLKLSQFGSSEAASLGSWEAAWLARRLYAEFIERSPAGAIRVEAITLQLLALAARAGREKQPGRESLWLRRVRLAIEGQYLHEYRLSELAALAGVHRVHLVREFRKHYGTTIGEYMRKLRMDYAYQLLGQTKLTLREIAAACRFADQSHFTKQFKKLSGLTPAEYRNLFLAARIESRPSGHDKQFGQNPHIGIGEAAFVSANGEVQNSGQANTI
jgi:AraC family transcriptional regulator